MRVFVALNESGILLYRVEYKTKSKVKYVHVWILVRGSITWRYK